MGSLIAAISDPLKGMLDAVNGVLDHFIASPEDKLKAQSEILKLQSDLQLKLIDADAEFAKSQATVITAEMGSGNWLASSWRPILMLVFTYIIFHNYVLATMFHLATVTIPPDMWDLLKLGIGGYVMGRSAEKIATAVAPAFTKTATK